MTAGLVADSIVVSGHVSRGDLNIVPTEILGLVTNWGHIRQLFRHVLFIDQLCSSIPGCPLNLIAI